MVTLGLDERFESLRVEYRAANAYSIHLTELNWQGGAILIGGSLAAVGATLITGKPIPEMLVTSASMVAIIAWILFLRINRDYSKIATTRMRMIETELGLGQLGFRSLIDYGSKTPTAPPDWRISRPNATVAAEFLAVGILIAELLLILDIAISCLLKATCFP
jgi:hypothetical protein